MPLNVLDVVQLRGERILDINDEDLPVGLAFIEKSHDTEDLDLLDLTDVADLLADLADVQGVIITLGLGLSMHLSGVLPGLHNSSMSRQYTVPRDLCSREIGQEKAK